MEPQSSLPFSQKPLICLYSEQISPVEALPTDIFDIISNIILPSTTRFFKCVVFLKFLYQNPVCTSLLPHIHHLPRPSHSSWFDHPCDTSESHILLTEEAQTMMQRSHVSLLQHVLQKCLPYSPCCICRLNLLLLIFSKTSNCGGIRIAVG